MNRVLLAETRSDVRSALRLLLEQNPQIAVTNEVAHSSDISPEICGEFADWVVLDWEMPGLNPARLVASIREKFAGLKILAIGSKPISRTESLKAGVDAFVSKADAPEKLVEAIQSFLANS